MPCVKLIATRQANKSIHIVTVLQRGPRNGQSKEGKIGICTEISCQLTCLLLFSFVTLYNKR
jgi:hypothetical protein